VIGWPVGVGWPKDTSPAENVDSLTTASASSSQDAQIKLDSAKSSPHPDEPLDPITNKYGLGHCNIWIGTTAERTSSEEPPQSKSMPLTEDDSWHLDPDDGIMLIYLPLLPNARVPDVDPDTTDYMSTWNFQYTPEQVDKVVELAERNYEVGSERIRRAVRAMWIRKKQVRLQRERESRILSKGKALISGKMGTLKG
jgi:cytosolic phospholipase A2